MYCTCHVKDILKAFFMSKGKHIIEIRRLTPIYKKLQDPSYPVYLSVKQDLIVSRIILSGIDSRPPVVI